MLLWRDKMTIASLGRVIGLDRTSLSLKMNGKRRWYFDEIQDIAMHLDTSVSFLTGETDNDSPITQKVPAQGRTGTAVAGAGLDPATSRL